MVDDDEVPASAAGSVNEPEMISDLVGSYPEHSAENKPMVEFMAMIMLKYRNYDLKTAKERLGNYLAWRKSLFGDLSDHAMDDSMGSLMLGGVIQTIMPPQGEGPMILFLRMRFADPSKHSTLAFVKLWHYLIIAAMKRDSEIARHGIIVINNLSGTGMGNIDRGVPAIIGPAVNNCMPIRLVSACLFNAPWIVSGIINIIKIVFSSKMQKRIHTLSDPVWFRDELKVAPALLPVELGGDYEMINGEAYRKLYQEFNIIV
jgi:hypothetical protein